MESLTGTNISSVNLAVCSYELAGGEELHAGEAIGIAYCVEGSATLEEVAGRRELAANQALRAGGRLRAGAGGAKLLRWSLGAAAPSDALLASSLSAKLPLLLRCDRVDFPPGGVAYTHTHRGPGIRVLLAGTLAVTTEGTTRAIQPGGAWFESGPEPVFAQASQTMPTSFIRVMVLPPELHGKSSIRYVQPEDQEKPKTQRYQVFIDDIVKVEQ